MLQYRKIDVSEGIDVNKTSTSEECELCYYWFFKDVGFKFEKHVCKGYHDLLTMAYSLKNIAILSAKRATFRCVLMGISKKTWKVILNKAKDYYKNNRERLEEQARDECRSLSDKEKNKKREYVKNRYHNMSEENKQRLNEYKKNYYKTKDRYSNKKTAEYYTQNEEAIKEKSQKRYSKEKAAEYYAQNKEAIKEKSRERYKNLSQEEKDKIKEYQRKRYQKLVQYRKEALKNKYF